MSTLFSFILVLGVLIFVHELGHFLFAKLFRVRVLIFSLGFGTKLVGKKWGETEYVLSAFPLGGYVKMYGEQPGDEVEEEEQARSFAHKPTWQRFLIVLAGPMFNLLFAIVLFFCIFSVAGLPQPVDSTQIGSVNVGSVAARAGLQEGDTIVAINGTAISSWVQVSSLVRASGGKKIGLDVQRKKERLHIEATPTMQPIKNLFGEEVEQVYMLGIAPTNEVTYVKHSMGEYAQAAVMQTWNLGYLTIMGIVKMIERVIPASELGGPIRIAEIAGQQMKAGWMNFLYFMGLLSVNLGILNLLPVPVLDGGHLVFLSLESIRRKPLSERTMELSQKVGIALLGTLMVFVFYNDIVRLVHRWMAS